MSIQVRCYDCGRLVPQGEAVKQSESVGNLGGGGYRHKSGWGAGGGSWKSKGKSYWLCIRCDRKRVENRRFWYWVMIGVVVAVVVIGLIIYLIVEKGKK